MLTATILLATCAGLFAEPPTTAPATPTDAVPQTGKDAARFEQHHQICLERRKQSPLDLAFLGDSITEGWEWDATPPIWKERYEPLHAANFGVSSDRTQNTLWRITTGGEFEGVHPKVVVLLIGTNNIGYDSTDAIAAGIEKVVRTVRDKTGAKVLLLAIFPRTMGGPENTRQVIAVNKQIAKLDDGKNIRFLDVGPKLLDGHDAMSSDVTIDGLHLKTRGYQIWSDAMQPLLTEMMR